MNRLAAFIFLTQHGYLYHEKYTQVAEYMGVSYRHLLFVITQLVDDGFLIKQKSGYAIKNKTAIIALPREMEPNGTIFVI